MKKLLTSLLSVMMVMCFMPSMAWAADDVASAEQITTAEQLVAAINAANDGDCITISGDIELSGMLTISKDITLDLGTHKITGPTGVSYLFKTSSNVTIKNGNMEARDCGFYVKTGTLNLNAVTLTSKNYAIYGVNDAIVNVNAGTEITSTDYIPIFIKGEGVFGEADCKTPTLNVYGTVTAVAEAKQAISTVGTDYSQPVINIYDDAKVTSQAATMYIPNAGSVNICGGTITGVSSAIAMKCGTLNISGGKLIATGEDTTPTEGYSNGINASGAAIQIESNDAYKLNANTPGEVKVNITGGTIESQNGYAIYEYLAEKAKDDGSGSVEKLATDTHLASLEISGGDILGNEEKKCMLISKELGEKANAINFTGGVYSSDVKEYVADKTVATLTSSGETLYYIGSDASKVASLAKENDTIEVIQGDLTLSNVKPGVTVKNANDGDVTVNGTTVEKDNEFKTPKPYILTTPTTQKPIIESADNATVTLSTDGTQATIKVADGYELVDVTVNGVSKGKVETLTGLKTGDKIVVKTQKKADDNAALIEAVKNTKLVARTAMSKAKGKKAVKVYWYAKDGSELNFDGYEVYRSLKRYEGFGTKPFFKTANEKYYNTAIKKGTKYYYKVRAYKVIDGEKVYTDWSTKAWRTVK